MLVLASAEPSVLLELRGVMGPSSRLLVLLALLSRAAAVALKKSEALPMVPEHLEERANASEEATVHAEAVQLEAEMREWRAYDHHARIRAEMTLAAKQGLDNYFHHASRTAVGPSFQVQLGTRDECVAKCDAMGHTCAGFIQEIVSGKVSQYRFPQSYQLEAALCIPVDCDSRLSLVHAFLPVGLMRASFSAVRSHSARLWIGNRLLIQLLSQED